MQRFTHRNISVKRIFDWRGKIECIQDSIRELPVECEVLDAEGKILTPGFLDQHVHITGGGGEGSFHTRTPELQMSDW